MTWRGLMVSACGTHHVGEDGKAAYSQRFDEVLKFHSPGLAPVLRDGAGWHVRVDGSPAYDRRFVRVFGYYEGYATAVTSDGWRHITADGQDAFSETYAWCGNFQQSRCTVRDDLAAYHHITVDGEAAYGNRWRYAGDYRDGIAVVQAVDGRSTHIDLNGEFVHRKWFLDLDVFHKGFARAHDHDGWMHVDQSGRAAYARRFRAVEPFYNGQARVELEDGALEVIDEQGATRLVLRAAEDVPS